MTTDIYDPSHDDYDPRRPEAGALARTNNLIKLHTHWVGASEVPAEYHMMCAFSMIAAAVADRVWLEKFAGEQLNPNLYVFLVGDSGTGKGTAIKCMTKVVDDIGKIDVVQGRVTAQHLMDTMATPVRSGVPHPEEARNKIFFVTSELATSIAKGELADTLIKVTTELYDCCTETFQEGTRTRGSIEIHKPCLNWIAATTKQWLQDCVDPKAMEGGFWARVASVYKQQDMKNFNPATRFTRPLFPSDHAEVLDYVKERVEELTHLEGPFTLSPQAKRVEDSWYNAQMPPTDPSLLPWWQRQHDLTLKLAMIFSLADSTDMVIEQHHMVMAQQFSEGLMAYLPPLIGSASATEDSKKLSMVKDVIHRSRRIGHSNLLRKVAYRGIDAKRLNDIIYTLKQAGEITIDKGPRKSSIYVIRNN